MPPPTPRCSARRWLPPRAPVSSLTSPRRGSLLNRRSRSPARWATSGCSPGPLRHYAWRITSPASRRQGARSGRNLSNGPGGSARTYLLTIDTIDPVRSSQLYAEAFACTERSGDHFTNCILHSNASVIALSVVGDVRGARAHLEAAAQAAQQIGWENNTTVQVNLGDVLRAERDLDGARSTFEAALRISRRNGDYWNMASAILGLACLASETGDWHRAALLHGVAQAFEDRTGNPWQELTARDRQESLDQARAHLGDEQLERAYAQGMALSLEKALDLALPTGGPA
jgi:tetratricopeptide (TPR) repeat protein